MLEITLTPTMETTTTFTSDGLKLFIIPIFPSVNLYICFKLFRKYWNDLKPVHVFLMNFFGTISLQFISNYFIVCFAIFPVSEDLCFQYYFQLITIMILCLGIISMQVDRFIAIFWDIYYKTYVTTSRAMQLCGLNIVIATTIGIAMGVYNIEYAKCITPYILFYTRKTNIILNGIPMIVTVIVTVAVSIYVVWKTKKLKNPIHPANQVTSEPPPNEAQLNIQRLDNQPDMFYRMELFNTERAAEVGTRQQNTSTDEETVGCLNQTELLMMLKTTKTMNLLTLILVIGYLPNCILGMIYYNCKVDSVDCANLFVFYNISRPVLVLGLIVLDLVALKRLQNAE